MAASGSVPPPKPWERVGSSSGPSPFRPSSTGSTSTVVESSGVAKTGESTDTERNVPLANRSTIGRPMPTRPWEQGSYGSNYGGLGSMTNYNSGYGSMTNYNSGYGSGLYGSNNSYGGMGGGYGAMSGSYGGGLYGNNMYRGGYGGSNMFGGMYNNGMGGPMGGYGMGPGGPYDNGNGNPNDPFGGPPSPPSFWQSMLRVGLDFTSLLELDRTKEVKQWRVGNISLLGKDGCLEVWIFLQIIVAWVVLYLQPYLYLLYPYDPVVPVS